MRLFPSLALCVLASLSLSGQTPGQFDQEQLNAEADFMELARFHLEKVNRAFGARDEAVITYRLETVPDLRVQFPVDSADSCGIHVWYIPEGTEPAYEALIDLFESSPRQSPVPLLEKLPYRQSTHSIPCQSSLGTLLGRARSVSFDPKDPAIPAYGIFFDTDRTSVEFLAQDVRMSATFPSSIPYPLATWASEVRVAVRAFINRGFEAP